MKALITGIGGFAGSHLARYLINEAIEVHGIIHPAHYSKNLEKIEAKIVLHETDLLKSASIGKIIKNNYDLIFHLAAFSSPSDSLIRPKETLENNIYSQVNLLDSLKKSKSSAKILIVGSSDEYGYPKKDGPITEEFPLNPQTPYAVSKVAQDLLGLQYFLHFGLNTVRVRTFNHIGPGQSEKFVVSSFAKQIAGAKVGKTKKIEVGNLDTWRDFTDVRDIVRGYLLALKKGKAGQVYNIGSGRSYKIGNILKLMISIAGVKVEIIQSKNLRRNEENKKITCDFIKFKKQTAWKPEISIEKTLSDTIDYELKEISQNG